MRSPRPLPGDDDIGVASGLFSRASAEPGPDVVVRIPIPFDLLPHSPHHHKFSLGVLLNILKYHWL